MPKTLHISTIILTLFIILGFRNNEASGITGTYIQEYSIGKIHIYKILVLKKDFQFTEKMKYRNNEDKSNFDRAGNWILKENTLILYNRKDEYRNCGNNANYYELECPNDTFIVKDKGLWSVEAHHDVIHCKQEYSRR